VEEIVRRAGVTRGALYHQFPGGKHDLFAEVFEQVEKELTESIGQTLAEVGADDPLAALRAGIDATLGAMLDPEIVRLTVIDPPSVLGWEAWRETGERYGLGLVRAGLTAAMDAGAIVTMPLDPIAQLLLASLEEAVVYVARADDREAAREQAQAALHRLLDGLTAS
jgi:AcrR family transcriptional regulator